MKKKTTNKKYQRKASNKKAIIITAAIVVFVMSLALTMTIWSSVAGVSPVALAKSWFIKPEVETQDGINLFDAQSAGEHKFEGLFVYTSIALDKDAEYVITTHTDKLENFDIEHAHLLLFSNTKFNDLPIDFDYETMFLTKDFEMVMIEMLPTSYKFSAAAYGFDYITLLTIDDLGAEDSKLQIKIEKGTYATAYSEFGKAATAAYHFTDFFADEIAAQFPTEEPVKEPDIEYPVIESAPIVVNTSIDALYLNTSAEADTILRSITPDADAGTNIIFNDEEGYYLSLMHSDEFGDLGDLGEISESILFLQFPDETIIPVWISSFDTDFVNFLADMDIIVDPTANFQIGNANLVAITGLTELSITHIGNSTDANYEMWGGESNFNALFSSTPWAE